MQFGNYITRQTAHESQRNWFVGGDVERDGGAIWNVHRSSCVSSSATPLHFTHDLMLRKG